MSKVKITGTRNICSNETYVGKTMSRNSDGTYNRPTQGVMSPGILEKFYTYVTVGSPKDILESGKHVVEYRDGNRALIVNDILMRVDGFLYLSDLDDDLKCDGIPDLDVMVIYATNEFPFGMENTLARAREVVWERNEKSADELLLDELHAKMDALDAEFDKAYEAYKKQLEVVYPID